MSRWLCGWVGVLAVFLVSCAKPAPAAGVEKSAAELLPESTLVYLEISRPKEVIGLLLDSPLRKQIEKLPKVRKAIDSPDFTQFQTIVGFIEAKGGIKWRAALEGGVGDGIVIAFDPVTNGSVVLAKASDAKSANAFRDAFFSLARTDAKNKGNPDPIPTTEYRGVTSYKAGEATAANLGAWLVISNKPELAKAIADKYLDGGRSLAGDKNFAEAHKTAFGAGTGPLAWGFAHLDPVRQQAAGAAWLDAKYKSDNPAITFLVGGLMPVLRKAPYISASLAVEHAEVKLSVATPMDSTWITPENKFFFALPGGGAARPLRPKGTLLSVSMYRDVPTMWQSGPDLFDEPIAAKMAQSDTQLSTFFGGKAFGTDVLGALDPQLQIVAVQQDFKTAGLSHEPSIKLPGFALVARVKPAKFEAVRKNLRVGFQTAMAFVNLDGTNKGRPVLDIQTEKHGGAEILFAAYDAADKGTSKDDLYLNFSPSLVMSSQYLMLCSTHQIAQDLVDLTEKEAGAKPTIADNTLIEIDAAGAAALVKVNREPLIAQNMLEKGHERAEAEGEIDLLQTIVSAFSGATVRLTPTDRTMQLEVDVKLAE